MSDFGLYLHFPYCDAKCGYCDFNSYALKEQGKLSRFTPALEREIEQAAKAEGLAGRTLSTVFLGGGTPSLWPAEEIGRVLRTVRSAFTLGPEAEVTMEANPGTVEEASLTAIRAHGINRISFGAQSFSAPLLKRLGRIHDPEAIVRSVRMARRAGFDRLNLDLMYGLPGQSDRDVEESVDAALSLEPDHISAYALELEPNTQFGRLHRQGKLQLPTDDRVVAQGDLVADRLVAAGFEQYEISNFARPGQRCRHNVLYWERGEYRGFGPGAHSFVGQRRFWNLKSPDDYVRKASAGESVVAGDEDVAALDRAEWVYLRLRLLEVRFEDFERAFRVPFEHAFPGRLGPLESDGLIEVDALGFRLTRSGRWLMNRVAEPFFG